jgi:hypothetical protein
MVYGIGQMVYGYRVKGIDERVYVIGYRIYGLWFMGIGYWV